MNDEVTESNDVDPPDVLTKLRELLNRQQWVEVEAVSRQALENTFNAEIAHMLGTALYGQRRLAEAKEKFGELSLLCPPYPYSIANIALCDYYMGDAEGAQKHLAELLERGDDCEAYLTMGHVLLDQYRLNEALAAYSKMDPSCEYYVSGLIGQAQAYRTMRKWHKADELLQQAAALNPNGNDLRIERIKLRIQQKRMAEARNELKLIEKDNALEYDTCCGFASVAEGNFRQAVEHFSRAISAEPNRADLYLSRARALIRIKHYTNAMADIDRGLSLSREPECFLALRGIIELRQLRFVDFIQTVKEILMTGKQRVEKSQCLVEIAKDH